MPASEALVQGFGPDAFAIVQDSNEVPAGQRGLKVETSIAGPDEAHESLTSLENTQVKVPSRPT